MQGPRGVIKSCFVIKHGRRHHFPNPTKYEDMFQKWLQYCDKEILTLPPDQVYKNRSVCSVHFTAEQFGSNNKLTVYPTLNIPNVQSLFGLYGEIPMLSLVEIFYQFPALKWDQIKRWARQARPRRDMLFYCMENIFNGNTILNPEMWAIAHTEINWCFLVPQVSCMWYSGCALGDTNFLICLDCRTVERRFFDEFPGLEDVNRPLIHRHIEVSPSMIRSILKCRRMWCNFCFRAPLFILKTFRQCYERLHLAGSLPKFLFDNYSEHTEDDAFIMDRLVSTKRQTFSNYTESDDDSD